MVIDSLLLSPKRLLSRIEEEFGRIKNFVERATEIRRRTEDLRRVAYAPYEDHKVPDLAQDFMQFAPLLDFQEAKLMLDVCRMEGFLFVAEGLLDRQDEAVFLALSGSSGPQERKSRTESEVQEFSHKVTAELRMLVEVALLVEGFASQVRSSIAKWRDGIPAVIAEHVALTSGGFWSLDAPLEISKSGYDGSIYWANLFFFLLTQCLEAAEKLLLPTQQTEAEEGTAAVVYLNRENFEVMTQQLLDWKDFVRDIRQYFSYFQVVTTICSLERDAVKRHGPTSVADRVAATRSSSSSRAHGKESKSKESSKRIDLQAILLGRPPSSSSSHSSLLRIVPLVDGNFEPSLRHILVLLYVRDLMSGAQSSNSSRGGEERGISNLGRPTFEMDSHPVSLLLHKCDYLLQYIHFLEQRIVQLADDGDVLSEDGKFLIIPAVNSAEHMMGEEGLTSAQKMFCKQLSL